MTKACYHARGNLDYDDNPLAAAIPLAHESLRAFVNAQRSDPRVDLLHGLGKGTTSPRSSLPSPSRAHINSSHALFGAVHESVLESYRRRNPVEPDVSGAPHIGFVSAPITLLTWGVGVDQVATALFEQVLKALPTAFDHVEHRGRAFSVRQLVQVTAQVDPRNVVRSTCVQIAKAADAAFSTTLSQHLPGRPSETAVATQASDICTRTYLGLLAVRAPRPLSTDNARALWQLARHLQLRSGAALFLVCSDFTARRMAQHPTCRLRLTNAKLFGVKRVSSKVR